MNAKDKKIFLTAEWNNLILANYAVPPQILTPFLPQHCSPSLWKGQAFVSIVGFQFNNTRVLNIKWPFFTHFLEINLRFYLDYQGQRAVCFIREYVPRRLITGIARALYNEPYKTKKITSRITQTPQTLHVEYAIPDPAHSFFISATAENKPYMPDSNSEEHFFKEHELGLGQNRNKTPLMYKVRHPQWRIFPVQKTSIQMDWEFFFGKAFSFLQGKKPHSVFLAEGSPVTIYQHTLIPTD